MTRWFHNSLQLHRRWKQSKACVDKRQIDNGRYTLIRQIGQGASGIVHLAVETKTNKKFAVKEMNKYRLERQYHQNQLVSSRRPLYPDSKKRKLDQDHVVRIEEIEILKQLPTHPNIIRFVQIIDNDPENEDSIFIVTEIAEKGVVLDVTPHSITKPIPEYQCREIFLQLVNAVEHLHVNRIVHRDIKPQNLVLSNNNIVKLIDFGNATSIADKLSSASSSVGSPAFMAPELLKRAARRNQESIISPTSADLWSMGVTLYSLVYGHLPFERSSLMDLYGDIQSKAVEHSDEISPSLKDLIDKLLEKNPENRIIIQDVKTHSWLHNK